MTMRQDRTLPNLLMRSNNICLLHSVGTSRTKTLHPSAAASVFFCKPRRRLVVVVLLVPVRARVGARVGTFRAGAALLRVALPGGLPCLGDPLGPGRLPGFPPVGVFHFCSKRLRRVLLCVWVVHDAVHDAAHHVIRILLLISVIVVVIVIIRFLVVVHFLVHFLVHVFGVDVGAVLGVDVRFRVFIVGAVLGVVVVVVILGPVILGPGRRPLHDGRLLLRLRVFGLGQRPVHRHGPARDAGRVDLLHRALRVRLGRKRGKREPLGLVVEVPRHGEVPHEPGFGHRGPYVLLRRLEREVADDDAPALGPGALAVTQLTRPQELNRASTRVGTRAGPAAVGGVGGRHAPLRELRLDPLRLALAHAGHRVV
mmetsp:Transcript_13566/g.54844  ORF Transcript_13566/g.54844 Transcript_13566/m.54844 type:complete len:369 (-) Transcript_13566:839-1945(-)